MNEWVEVTDKFKPLLIMYSRYFDEQGIYAGEARLYSSEGFYTHRAPSNQPQNDQFTIDWWTTAVAMYNLFTAQPSEAAKHLDNEQRFLRFMARAVMKGTFLSA